MKIAMGNDHTAIELKNIIKEGNMCVLTVFKV